MTQEQFGRQAGGGSKSPNGEKTENEGQIVVAFRETAAPER